MVPPDQTPPSPSASKPPEQTDFMLYVPQTTHPNEVTYENQTRLFRLIGQHDWEGAASRLASHPSESCIWVVTRFASTSSGDDKAVEREGKGLDLVGATAQKQENEERAWYRRLPLHHALEKRPPADEAATFLDDLIRANPTAVLAEDENRRVPLVHGLIRKAPPAAVETVLNERSVKAVDAEGKTPLHWAAEYGTRSSIIGRVVEIYPNAAKVKDGYGRLPLHCAALNTPKIDENVVRKLLEVYPEGIMVRDDDGMTPGDLASDGLGGKEGILGLLRVTKEK